MTTETQVPTIAETQNPATEPTETPEVVTPEATDDAGLKPDSTEQPTKTAEQLEVERLRRALTKRDRTQGKMHSELEQLRAQLARTQATPTPEETPEPAADIAAVVHREALTLAQQIAEHKEFTAKCNTVAEQGKKAFSDFSDALNTLIEEAGPLVDPKTGFKTVLGEQILEADAPAALIHHLGKNPELAAELDGLTPGRLARRLERIERELSEQAKPKTSSAPKPLEPIKAASSDAKDPSAMTDAEFAAWRRRQIAQRR
jgi:hypothetical protein